MWQVISNAIGSILGAIIIAALGIGSVTIITVSGSHNPRKKWRILMVISGLAFVFTGAFTTTYSGGLAHTSDFGGTLMWVWGLLFVLGFFGNWVNK